MRFVLVLEMLHQANVMQMLDTVSKRIACIGSFQIVASPLCPHAWLGWFVPSIGIVLPGSSFKVVTVFEKAPEQFF